MALAKQLHLIRRFVFFVMLALVAAACGSAASPTAQPEESSDTSSASTENASDQAPELLTAAISIPNNGTTALEGHTPRGFAGSGVGLFTGDNLNSNFPNGEGLQILLTFALPEGTGVPSSAILRSDVMSTSGNPFEALGELQAAPVSYQTFGPPLFNIEPTGDLVTCDRDESSVSCDVTAAAADAIAAGESSVQLRLTLEELSDNDGQQDLVLFFLTDSNTNEPGIFFLDLA